MTFTINHFYEIDHTLNAALQSRYVLEVFQFINPNHK